MESLVEYPDSPAKDQCGQYMEQFADTRTPDPPTALEFIEQAGAPGATEALRRLCALILEFPSGMAHPICQAILGEIPCAGVADLAKATGCHRATAYRRIERARSRADALRDSARAEALIAATHGGRDA